MLKPIDYFKYTEIDIFIVWLSSQGGLACPLYHLLMAPPLSCSSSVGGERALPCNTNPPCHEYFRRWAPFAPPSHHHHFTTPSPSRLHPSSLPPSGRRQGKMAPQKPLSATPPGFLSLGKRRASLWEMAPTDRAALLSHARTMSRHF